MSIVHNENESTSTQQFSTPEAPEGLAPLPLATSEVRDSISDTKKFNWLAYSFTNKLLKEYAVISVAVWVVYMLVTTLVDFMKSLTELFTQSVYFKSAPVLMVKTIDWHILLLGGTLIISITTILMVMLRSVLANNAVPPEEKKQHNSWDDMPLANFSSWVVDQIKSRFK